MQGAKIIKSPHLLLALTLGLALNPLTVANAQPGDWQRLGLDEGGVPTDIQQVYWSGSQYAPLADTIWSANMEGGLYRTTWSSGSYDHWIEHLPGRSMLGVDAYRSGNTEYVLGAGGSTGLSAVAVYPGHETSFIILQLPSHFITFRDFKKVS